MAESAVFIPARASSDHIAAAPRANEPSADAQASRPRSAGGLLRPSQVPLPGETTRRTGSPSSAGGQTHRGWQRLLPSGGPAGAALPLARPSTVPARPIQDILRGPSQPLAVPLREEMEARLGADFSRVRMHTDDAARASAAEVGARAYTCGSHVVIGDGDVDKHTLAHELTHVIQQASGQVYGKPAAAGLRISDPADRFERAAAANAARVMNGPAPVGRAAATARREDGPDAPTVPADAVVQRQRTFAPFTGLGSSQLLVASLRDTDTLHFHGQTYQRGSTTGNDVNLERLLRNTGGGSAPGEPLDVETIRVADARLVRANNQRNAATAMHAINADFVANANNDPRNIFMGSAKANRQHYWNVEQPIRQNMQSNKAGDALVYETAIRAHQPTPLVNHPGFLGWNVPGTQLPGADQPPFAALAAAPGSPPPTKRRRINLDPSPLPGLTHVVDPAAPQKNPKLSKWPKVIQYSVVPNYTYGVYPNNWPPFLTRNVNEAQQLVDAEEAKPPGDPTRAPQWRIDNEKDAIQLLKDHAHQLFPATYMCTAIYWLASYNPATPWDQGTETGTYNAEL